jgi:effector protein SidI
LRIRQLVAAKYAFSFKALSGADGELPERLALIDMIHKDEAFKTYDKEIFVNALLQPASIDSAPLEEIEEAISAYTKINTKLADKKNHVDKKEARIKLVAEWQTLISNKNEPYISVNEGLNPFYGKRKLSASEGFHLGYQANQRDPLKPKVIKNLIAKMLPIDDDTHLDIHIRPPDCGVLITAQDIQEFQRAGIKVNLTIHEYKQNYTRRYLQQYTHDLMRQADTVQFFNDTDRENAIIAATYGDCDKRNTVELSGVSKKEREVGRAFDLDKYPVEPYNLRDKSGLTVASQQLSTAPAHPEDVIEKPANILSFGTIRAGKGFEEALKLAQLVKIQALDIDTKINYVPVVKLAGDPQDKELMQKIVEERFGKGPVAAYQLTNVYESRFSHQDRRDYWKKLVAQLNEKVSLGDIPLSNPYIEIHPWCEAHELLELKESCKYVCRMDDMGMRNNGSAIISVLDVGIIYTKYGSVTDDIFVKGGKYGNAVDIGRYRYGKYSLLKKAEDYRAIHREAPFPKWLADDPDSPYKRKPESRDPQEILDSIIAREQNQLVHAADLTKSDNYLTVVEAQKLLTERFTLRNAVENLLTNVSLGHLIKEQGPAVVAEVDPVHVVHRDLAALAMIPTPRLALSRSCSSNGFFASSCRTEARLQSGCERTKLDRINQSVYLL